ncbi:hypothetical protein DFJ73DRAFT_303686 [Zopfochytrium polystomum]|nr:hypothetical protein DFJ73DRAFT_303686 [Zopfochytrium polystomum]
MTDPFRKLPPPLAFPSSTPSSSSSSSFPNAAATGSGPGNPASASSSASTESASASSTSRTQPRALGYSDPSANRVESSDQHATALAPLIPPAHQTNSALAPQSSSPHSLTQAMPGIGSAQVPITESTLVNQWPMRADCAYLGNNNIFQPNHAFHGNPMADLSARQVLGFPLPMQSPAPTTAFPFSNLTVSTLQTSTYPFQNYATPQASQFPAQAQFSSLPRSNQVEQSSGVLFDGLPRDFQGFGWPVYAPAAMPQWTSQVQSFTASQEVSIQQENKQQQTQHPHPHQQQDAQLKNIQDQVDGGRESLLRRQVYPQLTQLQSPQQMGKAHTRNLRSEPPCDSADGVLFQPYHQILPDARRRQAEVESSGWLAQSISTQSTTGRGAPSVHGPSTSFTPSFVVNLSTTNLSTISSKGFTDPADSPNPSRDPSKSTSPASEGSIIATPLIHTAFSSENAPAATPLSQASPLSLVSLSSERASSAGTSSSASARSRKRQSEPSGAGTPVRRLPCPVENCNKSFTTSGHLVRHQASHTGLRPYTCPIEGCNSRFSRNDNMLQHHRNHLRRLQENNKAPH